MAAGRPKGGDAEGEPQPDKPGVLERARRAMADHNATAPSGPMGMPEVVAEEPEDEGAQGPVAELVLERIHHYRDTIRSYQVLIEGQRVGQIRDDQSETFRLRPGSYTVRLQLLWIFSPKVEVSLVEGTQTRMVCGPNGGIFQAWRLFVAPTTAIFLRRAQA